MFRSPKALIVLIVLMLLATFAQYDIWLALGLRAVACAELVIIFATGVAVGGVVQRGLDERTDERIRSWEEARMTHDAGLKGELDGNG
jgi:hypothetical protein